MPATSLDQIVSLAKRRGFIFPSAEIYGGAGSILDLGPLGVEMNNNIKKLWWRKFVYSRTDMVGLDSAILTVAPILKASGHVDGFSDPLIECANCKIRIRADHYLDETDANAWMKRWIDEATKQRGTTSKSDIEEARKAAEHFFDFSVSGAPVKLTGKDQKDFVCPNPACRKQEYGEPRQFNMMFATNLGPVADEKSVAYLRPETAQGIFTNFKLVLDTARKKLPFGIAQIGKAFRNEITTGNSLFRVREFEQMEIEYFVRAEESGQAHSEWLDLIENFLVSDLGITKENLRRYEHPKESLSHYSSRTVDIEYNFPFGGWGELWGTANRGDYDLRQHQEASGRDLTYFDEVTRERFLPHVIEPSVGLGRMLLTILIDSYKEYPNGRDGQGSEMEIVLHLPKEVAPVRAAILPLMKKDGLSEKAHDVFDKLVGRGHDYLIQYDDSGAIGRRYRRQDEIGTPYCVTVDYQTLEDGTVTLRDRDTMEQKRVSVEELAGLL